MLEACESVLRCKCEIPLTLKRTLRLVYSMTLGLRAVVQSPANYVVAAAVEAIRWSALTIHADKKTLAESSLHARPSQWQHYSTNASASLDTSLLSQQIVSGARIGRIHHIDSQAQYSRDVVSRRFRQHV